MVMKKSNNNQALLNVNFLSAYKYFLYDMSAYLYISLQNA